MTALQDFLNSPIRNVSAMGRAPKTGDLFGLELECEGRNVDWDGSDPALLKDWAPHHDGSLRAHHGSCQEWVFNGPVKYDASVKRVDKLFDFFDKRKAKLVCSNRTSFHVHYNMGDKNAYQLVNLFILYTIFEDLLDGYCGDDRRGNLFCLSSRHAEEQLKWVADACFRHQSFANLGGNMRYCSLNMASINKFGTVEFRAMRGLDNKTDVLAWLSIINEFCEYACYTMKNPVKVVEDISLKTPIGFMREVFSKDNYERLTNGLDEGLVNASIYEGLRLVQMLVYRIGTEFDQVRLRGRDFWASFAGDAEPELDVDPANVAVRGGGLNAVFQRAAQEAQRRADEEGEGPIARAQRVVAEQRAMEALQQAARPAAKMMKVHQPFPRWMNEAPVAPAPLNNDPAEF